jgi:NAD(P)-dependent dehydrogenase (short-subunit alcohol dehydrogenase family)
VILTGAGSGLGRGTALALAGKGWRMALVGRRQAALLATRDAALAVGAAPDDCLVVAADVTDRCGPDRVVMRTLDAFGQIDALVNNAGLARFAPLDRADPAHAVQMLQTNLLAPAALIERASQPLRRARGVVINIGSIGGLLATPARSYYGASKAALHHLTRSLARELAPEVRVNAVLPGAIDTEMYDDLALSPDRVAALREDLIRTTPLGRMGTPQDVVPWIELMLGPAGRWMTGTMLVVDGGRSC